METYQIIFIVVIVIIAALLGFPKLTAFLSKKGFNVDRSISIGKSSVEALDKIIDALKPVVPNNVYLGMFDRILETSKKAFTYAEELSAIGKIGKGAEKKAAAMNQAEDFFINTLKIPMTGQLKSIISGTIEACVDSQNNGTDLSSAVITKVTAELTANNEISMK